MIRLLLIIFFILLFAIYSIINAIVCFILSFFDKNKAKKIDSISVKTLFKIIIFIAGVRLHVNGMENIDEKEAIFIISNHRSFFDIIIGYTLIKGSCGFVAKDSIGKIWFLKYWMEKIDCLFLDRKNLRSGMEMLLNAIKSINNGISIWLCPEGTRNKNIDPTMLLEFKSGSFKIPEKAKCRILPIAFYWTEKVFESQKPFIKSADVYVSIGRSYSIDELSDADKENVHIYSQNIIKNMLIDIKSKVS